MCQAVGVKCNYCGHYLKLGYVKCKHRNRSVEYICQWVGPQHDLPDRVLIDGEKDHCCSRECCGEAKGKAQEELAEACRRRNDERTAASEERVTQAMLNGRLVNEKHDKCERRLSWLNNRVQSHVASGIMLATDYGRVEDDSLVFYLDF